MCSGMTSKRMSTLLLGNFGMIKSSLINSCRGIAIPNQSNSDLHNQALDEKVRSMMEKGKKMMTDGEQMTDGTLKQRKSGAVIVTADPPSSSPP